MIVARGSRPALAVGPVSILVLVLAMGCAAVPAAKPPCPTEPSDVGTVDGWTGYLSAHSNDVALVVDDGRGSRVEHRANEIQPMASASKALDMVAYARSVASGTVSPDEPVRLGEWERWAVFGGGEPAHASALDTLRIPRNGMRARDPNRTVALDQLVTQMIAWSDNAAPDYLRNRLGDQALIDAARVVGWNAPELPSTTGVLASYYAQELLPPPDARAARRAAEWEIARRYAYDPAFRADLDSRTPPPKAGEPQFVDGGPGGTANQLAALWSAVGRGTFPGADIAQRVAEQTPNPAPGIRGVGAKGGSSPSVLTRGAEIRRTDGTVAVAVLLVRRMSVEDTERVNASSQAFNDFLIVSMQDPSVLASLRCRFPSL